MKNNFGRRSKKFKANSSESFAKFFIGLRPTFTPPAEICPRPLQPNFPPSAKIFLSPTKIFRLTTKGGRFPGRANPMGSQGQHEKHSGRRPKKSMGDWQFLRFKNKPKADLPWAG